MLRIGYDDIFKNKYERKTNMNNENIRRFYEEVKESLDDNYKIIIESKEDLDEDWVEYDSVKWTVEQPIEKKVNELLNKKSSTLEEKILKLYEYICLNYVYDDNVLFFFRKDLSDPNNIKYIAVDWYGRIVGNEWKTIDKIIIEEYAMNLQEFMQKQ